MNARVLIVAIAPPHVVHADDWQAGLVPAQEYTAMHRDLACDDAKALFETLPAANGPEVVQYMAA